ncbi:hypothetical protein [Streptomyces hyaluromycini]|uniref:hypothetical protein n=1 Tax=Streptomyces hyaluromycini TaxID=1377993 RepID=UPI0011AEA4F6|nr:hypothetical protein [Streptomyces hyaluromycini]
MPFVAPHRDDPEELLPVVLAVVVTDALQAVAGFGLVGLKRAGPSLVSTAVWFGILAAVSVPVADAAGLPGLWTALAWPTCSRPSPRRSPSGGTPAASPRPPCRRGSGCERMDRNRPGDP